jgi:hypothetical protein
MASEVGLEPNDPLINSRTFARTATRSTYGKSALLPLLAFFIAWQWLPTGYQAAGDGAFRVATFEGHVPAAPSGIVRASRLQRGAQCVDGVANLC